MERKTLLLTSWFFPIRIIRWQDAIKLKYEGGADVVVEYDEEVKSPSIVWKMPAVLRLKKTIGNIKRGIKFSRINVYTRDNFQCLYCLKKYPVRALTYDHVIPRAAGGKTTWENVVTACKNCNAMKADKSCDESGMWPAKQPFRPKSLPFVSPITNMDEDAVPEEWKAFLDTSPA